MGHALLQSQQANRLAARWAGVLCAYAVLIVLAALLRLYLRSWGLVLTRAEQSSLLVVLGVHALFAIATGSATARFHRRPANGRRRLRLLATFTPFLLLISADGILGFFAPPLYSGSELYVKDQELGWCHRQGAQPSDDKTIKINAKGLRGPDVLYQKDDDEYRILFLGDSIAFGIGVEHEETFVARVQEMLSRGHAGKRVTTINMSVSGYGPRQQCLFLQHEGLKYAPDLVVQCFCLNDVTEKFDYFVRHPHFQVLIATSPLEWSGLYRFARDKIMKRRLGQERPRDASKWVNQGTHHLVNAHDAEDVRRAWSLTKKNMKEIVALCRSHEIPLAVACVPFAFQLDLDPVQDHPQQELGEFCRKHNVPYLDMLPAMRSLHALHRDSSILFSDTCHLSPGGHRLVAEEIIAFLRREGLLPE
ncbi:MAG: SGNH/GDSL hydrolase family protein [Phycisphaerales bacterium]|nr:MAG: SGNH/GDSL hydrolase family protein [Phycisphaerales bacterium]